MGLLHSGGDCRVWDLRFQGHSGFQNGTWAQGGTEYSGALNITCLHEKGLEKLHYFEKQRGSLF